MTRVLHAITLAAVALAAAGLASHADALQQIDANEERTIAVKVPAKELTRILFERSRIRRFEAREGQLEVKPASDRAHLQVIPLTDAKPVTLFLTSDSGRTYTLLLQPIDSPVGETVVLREARAAVHAAPAQGSTAPHQERIIRLIYAMARGEPLEDADISRQAQELSLWREARLTRLASYALPDLLGEIYQLSNVSPAPMRLAEQELYTPGVHAIAIEQHELAPGDSTQVLVVREKR